MRDFKHTQDHDRDQHRHSDRDKTDNSTAALCQAANDFSTAAGTDARGL